MTDGARRPAVLAAALVGTAAIAFGPFLPGLSPEGRYALATTFFAAVLWVTEALPLPVTALCVPLLLTAFGVFPTFAAAAAGFADPVVFLLLGGFVLAEALRKHDVDRRIAFRLVGRLGTSPRRLVLAVMIATAALSMLLSNSATTAMMVPVALGVARQVRGPARTGRAGAPESPGDGGAARAADHGDIGDRRDRDSADGLHGVDDHDGHSNVEIAMLLGVAYAATIGGVGTLIGTPPNAIVVAQLATRLDYRIGFVDWLLVGVPLVVVSLPIAWYLLAVRLYPPEADDASGARRHARAAVDDLGPLGAEGRRAVYVAGATAGLWLLGGFDFLLGPAIPATWYTTLFGGPGASLFGTGHQGVLYFVVVGLAAVPALAAAGAVEWDDVERIDWGTLILLGGGIALANALAATDAVRWLADVTFGSLVGAPAVVLVFAVVAVTILFSELASNTAIAAIFAPILISIGPRYAASLGTSPTVAAAFLAVSGAVASSFGFALPVATPPNAIVFGTGNVTKDHMLRAGVVLDAVLAVVVTGALLALVTTVWSAVL